MFGAWGKLAKIDLANRKVTVEEIGEDLLQKYFSGSGLAAYLLFQAGKYAAEPLGPENDFFFIPGLLTGAPVHSASRTSLCAKSPLTGVWGESNFGGYFGSALKGTGVDGLWITGESPSPVYLWVTPEKIEIRDAREIWGKNTIETDRALRERTDERAKVACIGRAGEKLCKIASVMGEGLNARAAGRTGLGAVLGSKKLKGVAVLGSKKTPVRDPAGLGNAVKEFLPTLQKYTAMLSKLGTARLIRMKIAYEGLPLKNFSHGVSWAKEAEKISGEVIRETIWQKDSTCYSCPIGCGKDVKIGTSPYRDLITRGPEYETLAGFGSDLLNDDLESIVVANNLCNDYGLDTISTSEIIGFAMEAFERGLITQKDCDGLELTWGNAPVILGMIRKIGERDGIGDLLAEGSRIAALKLGDAAEDLAPHAKGLEPSATAPTPTVSLGLSWATSNRGACHLEGFSHIVEGGVPFQEMGYGNKVDGLTNEGKGRLVKVMQDFMAVFNTLGICKMLFGAHCRPRQMAEWVHFLTGWDMDEGRIITLGDRIYNLKRAYNVKLGVTRKDDVLSPKLLDALRKEGTREEKKAFFEKMLVDYYRERGWDDNGIPSPETLQKLGLEYIQLGSRTSGV